jgi:predicted metal-binding membrane protein
VDFSDLTMTWLPVCGQKSTRAAASFIGMWMVMMIAMMLPSLAPTLWRYYEAISRRGAKWAAWRTLRVCIGYYFIWAILGAVVLAASFVLTSLALRFATLPRVFPFAATIVVLAAGLAQLSAWKARHLACCRACAFCTDSGAPLRIGARLGMHCVSSCTGLVAVLLVTGMMDWRAVTLITAATTAERVTSNGERIARATGMGIVAFGLSMLARTVGIF